MSQSTSIGLPGGGDIQGEGAGNVKLHIMWGDSGDGVLEEAHVEEAWQKHIAYDGG